MELKLNHPFGTLGTHFYFVFIIIITFNDGKGKNNSRSKRPGLRSAGSMFSIRFVAPTTTTSESRSSPSIICNRVFTTVVCTWSFLSVRIGANPSSSSKNIIHGWDWLAYKGKHKMLYDFNKINTIRENQRACPFACSKML